MSREVRLNYHDYGEDSLPLSESSEVRAYGTEAHAEMTVPYTELDVDDLSKGHDRAELRMDGEVWFSGIVEDVVRNDYTKTLIVEGWERLAERAEPLDGAEQWAGSDAAIVRDVVDTIDGLERGEIETTNPSTQLLFSPGHSHAYRARQAEKASPGFLFYNPDQTVDYGDVGANKSHYTLSPRRDNVSSQFEINEAGGYEQVTHLRMLGAGEQEHQVTADAVADDYTPGEEQIWKVYPDKSIEDEATLQDMADRFVDEMQTPLLDIELTVQGVRCKLGDTFRVYIPSEDVDEVLRIVEHERTVTGTEGVRHHVTLSNHIETRETPNEKNEADLANYNQAIEGAPMNITGGGHRRPVTPDHNWHTLHDRLPGVVHEHRAELLIEGEPYLAYSAGADSGGAEHHHTTQIQATSAQNSDFESTVTARTTTDSSEITASWETYSSALITGVTSQVTADASFGVIQSGGSTTYANASIEWRVVAQTDDGVIYHPGQEGTAVMIDSSQRQKAATPSLRVPNNLENVEAELQARLGSNFEGQWYLNSDVLWQGDGRHIHEIEETATSSDEIGEHGHLPKPGVYDAFEDEEGNAVTFYPSECDVIVNGQSQGLSLGTEDEPWRETVDISGQLNDGINRVEVTSETLGHIICYIQGEAVRRIHGREL